MTFRRKILNRKSLEGGGLSGEGLSELRNLIPGILTYVVKCWPVYSRVLHDPDIVGLGGVDRDGK